MLERVISGGQTGADQNGLKAAKACGIPTGGTMPKGCLTEIGCDWKFAATYGLQEHESDKYPPRTEQNVVNSDGTVRLAGNFKTGGETLTLKLIHKHNKPHFDINRILPPSAEEFVQWIKTNNIKVLNVAGNRESTSPGIGQFVFNYLTQAFQLLGHEKNDSSDHET